MAWTTHIGTWTDVAGILQGSSANGTYGIAFKELNPVLSDYTIETQIQFSANGYGGGIGGRLNPSTGARYGAWIYITDTVNENIIKLIKFTDWENWTLITSASLPTAIGTSLHTLKLSFVGTQIQAFYDGTLVINAADNSYSSGSISADLWTNQTSYTMQLSNLTVTPYQVTPEIIPISTDYNDWKVKFKKGPWPFTPQGPVYGYINNPNWVAKDKATEIHTPCGYWPGGGGGGNSGNGDGNTPAWPINPPANPPNPSGSSDEQLNPDGLYPAYKGTYNGQEYYIIASWTTLEPIEKYLTSQVTLIPSWENLGNITSSITNSNIQNPINTSYTCAEHNPPHSVPIELSYNLTNGTWSRTRTRTDIITRNGAAIVTLTYKEELGAEGEGTSKVIYEQSGVCQAGGDGFNDGSSITTGITTTITDQSGDYTSMFFPVAVSGGTYLYYITHDDIYSETIQTLINHGTSDLNYAYFNHTHSSSSTSTINFYQRLMFKVNNVIAESLENTSANTSTHSGFYNIFGNIWKSSKAQSESNSNDVALYAMACGEHGESYSNTRYGLYKNGYFARKRYITGDLLLGCVVNHTDPELYLVDIYTVPAPPEPVTISGFALDGETPIDNCTITLEQDSVVIDTVITGIDGAYSFTVDVMSGYYTLTPTAEGYIFNPLSIDREVYNVDIFQNFAGTSGAGSGTWMDITDPSYWDTPTSGTFTGGVWTDTGDYPTIHLEAIGYNAANTQALYDAATGWWKGLRPTQVRITFTVNGIIEGCINTKNNTLFENWDGSLVSGQAYNIVAPWPVSTPYYWWDDFCEFIFDVYSGSPSSISISKIEILIP